MQIRENQWLHYHYLPPMPHSPPPPPAFLARLAKFMLWPSSSDPLIQISFQFLFHSSCKSGGMHVCGYEYGCVCLFKLFGTAVESKHDSGMQCNLVLKCGFVPVYTIILEDSKNGCPRTQWFLTSQLFQTWRSQTAIMAPSVVLGFTSEFPSLLSHYLPALVPFIIRELSME